MAEPTQPELSDQKTAEHFKAKIVRTLKIFPRLSPSMLHIGIGPAVPVSVWRPVLDTLIISGVIRRDVVSVPGGRDTMVLSLSDPNYQLPN